jgi:hypothetical protein
MFRNPHRSNLLDEERGTGRRRPVAGVVDRDERDRIVASLGNVYDGSITGRGMVQDAVQVDLIGDGRLRSLVVEGMPPEYIQFQTTDIPTPTAARRGGWLCVRRTDSRGRHRENIAWRRQIPPVQVASLDGDLIGGLGGQPMEDRC